MTGEETGARSGWRRGILAAAMEMEQACLPIIRSTPLPRGVRPASGVGTGRGGGEAARDAQKREPKEEEDEGSTQWNAAGGKFAVA